MMMNDDERFFDDDVDDYDFDLFLKKFFAALGGGQGD